MPEYSGDVTLLDGRQFHGVVRFTERERDTGASDMISAAIYDMEGNELDADAQNEEIEWPNSYDGKDYLWSIIVDLLADQPPDEEDYGY